MTKASEQHRSDPRITRKVVNSIFEAASAQARQSYCKFLAASIAFLFRHHPDRWGVTLIEHKNVVRLNAGWVESLVLHSGGLRVLVHKKTAPARTNFDGRRYVNAPGCETAAIPLYELPRSLPALAESHHKALEITASRRPAHRKILIAHSIGVTKWLSQVLGHTVPNPTYRQPMLHIVQGGIQNGDKALLERLEGSSRTARSWVVPKTVVPGDEIIVFIRDFGFFASATAGSQAKPRPDWKNRYGADLESITLIRPPVSLVAIRRHIPDLEWAKYPRGITTPQPQLADQIRAIIGTRKNGEIDLDDDFLAEANIDELRKIALLKAHRSLPPRKRAAIYRAREAAIRKYVLRRANGRCEGCLATAPFRTSDGRPFLETHHTTRVADDGPDHPRKVIGLCPNCHRRAHLSEDAESFNATLIKKLPRLEAAAGR